ncbi:nuclear transport factor 2 family protein [Sphingomicrobium flavum]|uniref:nuclear transport factor 2 family protein n=1 Tax=Sphingomicrobium flavum TaxID=1229164 RepID=UPI0021AD868B|nr:nuclear transport factor 2 family protein [Sphingomicrobium flavum]
MSTNLETVKALYAAFDQGDIAGATAAMADDIVWNEAENNKLADRNPYVGPQAIVEGVFVRLAEDFDGFGVDRQAYAVDGDTVVMRGRYQGTSRHNGQAISPQVVHWWTLTDGKITGFQQYVDTVALANAVANPNLAF